MKPKKRHPPTKFEQITASIKKQQGRIANFVVNKNGRGYDFWRLHALNYFTSDYQNGLWEPLFPEAYTGTPVGTEVLYTRILNRHLGPDKRLSDAGVRCLIWVSLKGTEMYPLVWKVTYRARLYGGDPHAAGDPQTWMTLEFLGALMKKSAVKWDEFQERAWSVQGAMERVVRDLLANRDFNVDVGEEGTPPSHVHLPPTSSSHPTQD